MNSNMSKITMPFGYILIIFLIVTSFNDQPSAQVMRICENGDCLQLARRTSLAGNEDLNGIYNLMRYLRQSKVIGTNFNSPFL
uniref:Uncharacterized protein n=1 Tax=Tetranychus urticae TaxID=32264 RepID=T1KXL5_TETUR